jgi:hypothetical protein
MSESLQQVLSRLKEYGQSHGVDFKSEILSYDYKRRGIITPVALHKWVGSMGTSVGNRGIQQLVMAYQKGDGIDALKLIEDIEKSQTLTAAYRAQPAQCTTELMELSKELMKRRQNLREVLAAYDLRMVPLWAIGDGQTTKLNQYAWENFPCPQAGEIFAIGRFARNGPPQEGHAEEGFRPDKVLAEIRLRLAAMPCSEAATERTNGHMKRVLSLNRLRMGGEILKARMLIAKHTGLTGVTPAAFGRTDRSGKS